MSDRPPRVQRVLSPRFKRLQLVLFIAVAVLVLLPWIIYLVGKEIL